MNKLKNMNYYKFDELSISRDLEKKNINPKEKFIDYLVLLYSVDRSNCWCLLRKLYTR